MHYFYWHSENVFWAFHFLEGTISCLNQAKHLALENFAFFCVNIFALESVVVVSGAS